MTILRETSAAALLLLGLVAPLDAQGSRARLKFAELEGTYAYQNSATLVIVGTDSILFAVIDEAKYPLRPIGDDRFLNSSGDTIPFRRGADGMVSGFVERSVFYPRRSPTVDPAIAEAVLAIPRPLGPDGRPVRYVYTIPTDAADGLRVGHAAEAGLDTASVARLVHRMMDGTYPNMHSVLVYRGGTLVVEEYFYEYDRKRPHQMRSASKSVISALVGIAIDRGALRGDDELVTKRLPYTSYANPDPRKDRLMLRDLLTMRSGFACDDWNQSSPGNESRVYQSEDWVKFVMDLPMTDAPGTQGRYCSGNVKIAGRMVEGAIGEPLTSFAQKHLFTPLGIRSADVRWNNTLSASNASTFGQFYLRPRDMLKLGVLFHQEGRWRGRQVISREWVKRSTAAWSTVGDQKYGYFWWHQWVNLPTAGGSRRVDMVVASGNGGQRIFIVPSLDLVVVLTGGNYNAQSPASSIMINELLPAFLPQSGAPAR